MQPIQKRIRPWLVAVALFMDSLDTTIPNTTVPAIAEVLGIAAAGPTTVRLRPAALFDKNKPESTSRRSSSFL